MKLLMLFELNLKTDQKDHNGWSAVERIETSIISTNIYPTVEYIANRST